jgi:hypothetical protein
MCADILSWSRAALFAGLARRGTTRRQDLDDNATLYGKKLDNRAMDERSSCAQGRRETDRAAEPVLGTRTLGVVKVHGGFAAWQRALCGHFFHVALLAIAVQAAPVPSGQADILNAPELDVGFRLLYELKPEEARAQFAAWQASHPEDPLGSAAEAASYLFEECHRLGVLTPEFFLDDKRFLGKISIKPDQELRDAFFAAELRAQDLARLRLETDPEDANALFAMTLSLGMQVQYASLIEKHQLESLSMIREADKVAKKLLAVKPNAADAYLGLGVANYIIGSLPAFKRFFLHFRGISGDKRRGIQQLEIAAMRGRYLRPFAKIILAMAALREKKIALARTQLMDLGWRTCGTG